MKLIYTKQEALEIIKNHIADLLDVEVTDVTVSQYSEDFLAVTCTKVEKTKNPRRWIKDESYRDPAPAAPELE
jgi:hypothetical protein